MTSVAESLHVDQPRVSKLVAAGVEAGLLRREADQADGRRTVLVRTAAGPAASEHVHQFRCAVFAAAMKAWSPAERADFACLLSRFVDGLSATNR